MASLTTLFWLRATFRLFAASFSFSARDCNFHQARSQDARFVRFADSLDGSMNDAKECFAIPNLFFRSFTHYLVLRSLFNIYKASIPFDVTPVQVLIIPDFRLSSDAFPATAMYKHPGVSTVEVSLLCPSLTMI